MSIKIFLKSYYEGLEECSFKKKYANWLMIKEKLGKFSWQANKKEKKIKE